MIIGILSDSHGRAERTAAAIRVLKAAGATAFVHCGDIGTETVLDELPNAQPLYFVWGNNDDERGPLARYAAALGLTLPPKILPLRFSLAGKRFTVVHGHERAFGDLWRGNGSREVNSGGEAVAGDAPDYVLYGHSHVAADDRRGTTRFVNPGALHRAPVFTVATLDLESGKLHFWELRDNDPAAGPARGWPLQRD